ncbi:MAG: NAD(P)H-dependent oxidoreductase [Patescibacteria group bacterium]
MKTLIVSFFPREEASNTKKILENIKPQITGEVEHLDLVKNLPDFFLADSLNAYYKRNYMGVALDSEELKTLEKMDRMTSQLKTADILILAFPMHNFSMPAAVKAYFDSILLKGETWDMNDSGYIGLLKGKKALVLSSSGGRYNEELGTKAWDFVTSQTQVLLGFMGFESQIVIAQGLASQNRVEENLKIAEQKALEIITEWYK